jgi:hypothetical protein
MLKYFGVLDKKILKTLKKTFMKYYYDMIIKIHLNYMVALLEL